MHPMYLCAIGMLAVPVVAASGRADETRAPQPVRRAVVRSLSLMQKSLREYPLHETCFSCHHQGVPMFALSLARSRGFAVDEKTSEAVIRQTSADLRGEIEAYRSGKGQPGGVTRAGYALLALESGGLKRNDITTAVTSFLIQRDKELGYWRSSADRPPAEKSAFTDTF